MTKVNRQPAAILGEPMLLTSAGQDCLNTAEWRTEAKDHLRSLAKHYKEAVRQHEQSEVNGC